MPQIAHLAGVVCNSSFEPWSIFESVIWEWLKTRGQWIWRIWFMFLINLSRITAGAVHSSSCLKKTFKSEKTHQSLHTCCVQILISCKSSVSTLPRCSWKTTVSPNFSPIWVGHLSFPAYSHACSRNPNHQQEEHNENWGQTEVEMPSLTCSFFREHLGIIHLWGPGDFLIYRVADAWKFVHTGSKNPTHESWAWSNPKNPHVAYIEEMSGQQPFVTFFPRD